MVKSKIAKEKIIVVLVFLIFVISILFAGSIFVKSSNGDSLSLTCNYTETTDTIYNSDTKQYTKTFYSGSVNIKNSSGIYRPFSEVVSFNYTDNKLVLSWNGKEIKLEPYIETNTSNKFNFSQISISFPVISQSIQVMTNDKSYEFDISLSNANATNITKIGFRLNSISGISNYSLDGSALIINDLIRIDFTDTGLPVSGTKDNFYITGIANRIDEDGDLYLDPTVTLQTANSENLRDAFVLDDFGNTNYGSATNLTGGNKTDSQIFRSYLMFNISSLPLTAIINASNLSLYFSYKNDYLIESSDDMGKANSIGVDSNGVVHISHTDITNEDLRYCNNSDGSWNCEIIEAGLGMGFSTSLAIDLNDKIHIAHQDYENEYLRYCTNAGGSWSCENADAGTAVGYNPSIALDSNDKPHISHGDVLNTCLKYCRKTGVSWECEQVENPDSVGRPSSIGVDSNNKIHISHWDQTNDNLRYCNGTYESWTCEELSNDGGNYNSLAIDDSDKIRVSYYVDSTDDLAYCRGYAGSWACDTSVDTTGVVGKWNSLAIDSYNNSHIIYFDDTNDNLKYCNGTGSGPMPWTCRKIITKDNPGTSSSGRSIAIDSNNEIYVSYYESINDDLRYWHSSLVNFDIYEVYEWKSDSNGSSQTESTLTWNTQPCGTNFTNSTFCNLTFDDSIGLKEEIDIWEDFDTTNILKNAVGNDNVSFVLKANSEDNETYFSVYSKEYAGDTSLRPKLTVVYSVLYPEFSDIEVSSGADNLNHTFNITWTDESSVWYDWDGTNYTNCYELAGEVWQFNKSSATPIGDYTYEWYANSTTSAENKTGILNYEIYDATAPHIVINSPSGIVVLTTFSFNFDITDNIDIEQCYYNVTNTVSGDYVINNVYSNRSIINGTSANWNGSDDTGSEAVFKIWVGCNDTNDNWDYENQVFTVSIPEPPPPPGNGGAPPTVETGEPLKCTLIPGKYGWSAANEVGGSGYDLRIPEKLSRTKRIVMKNTGTDEVNVELKCFSNSSNICDYIKIDPDKLELPLDGESVFSYINIDLLESDYKYGEKYLFYIIIKDQQTCKLDFPFLIVISKWGYIFRLDAVFAKLGKSMVVLPLKEWKGTEDFRLPIALVMFLIFIALVSLLYLFFRKVISPLKSKIGDLILSIIISIFVSFAILIFI